MWHAYRVTFMYMPRSQESRTQCCYCTRTPTASCIHGQRLACSPCHCRRHPDFSVDACPLHASPRRHQLYAGPSWSGQVPNMQAETSEPHDPTADARLSQTHALLPLTDRLPPCTPPLHRTRHMLAGCPIPMERESMCGEQLWSCPSTKQSILLACHAVGFRPCLPPRRLTPV